MRQNAGVLGAMLLLLFAVPEVQGSSGDLPPPPASLRGNIRVRASVAGTGTFAIAREAPSGGAGVMGELGFIAGDRVSLLVHLELATSILHVIGSLGLMAEVALNDRFSISLGAAMSAWRTTCSCPGEFYGPTFPLRINFAPLGRRDDQTARKGLMLGLQMAPGYSAPALFWLSQPERFAFTTTVSVGYAAW